MLNYGTGGYGTYQSLLVLEQEFSRFERPALVIYEFFAHHEVRNVADNEWLRILSSYSRRAHGSVPYGTVDGEDRLIRHAPEKYMQLPFRERLATVAYVENLYMRVTASGRGGGNRPVTTALLEEMNWLCAQMRDKTTGGHSQC